MPTDVSLVDIVEGAKSSWASVSALTAIIPASRVYFQRAAESTSLPYALVTTDDVSAFYGGTEYDSSQYYKKSTRVNFKVYFPADFDISAFATILNDAFGWTATNPAASWTIPNAIKILSAMPEVEKLEIEEERVDGKDVIRYESSFTVTMVAYRG